ncbi:MAG: hypothetical protein ACI8W8_002461 [Rhodothermales bacterium]|jgi:hypothetical protein
MIPVRFFLIAGLIASFAVAENFHADVIVYGGTSAGVVAAVQSVRMGKRVILVGPDKHLGGLSSGGLGWTDSGNKSVIGGLSREFYHRIWQQYQKPESWPHQKPSEYGGRGQGSPAIDGDSRTMWIFEPSIAEAAFETFIADFDIPVHRDEWLNRETGVQKNNGRITAITMLSGKTYHGKMFIDATYEGDLMATASISYHVGREGRDVYGEDWNGVQTSVLHHRHHFDAIPNRTRISPYRVPGDPSSGILPRISPDPPGDRFSGDHRVQAYCFRMCLTNHPDNRIPFPKPEHYDPDQYQLLLRIFEAGWKETFGKFDPIPNYKTDTNNHGPMSTDNIGMNYDYPDGSYEERRAIIAEHENYQKGWLYFIANDPRVPESIRLKMQSWGLPKDEYTDNGNWSHQLYIREARRMVGKFVMTENQLLEREPTPESIGMGSYTLDSHNVQRYITPEGYVQNEGDIGVRCNPYQIAYGSLLPKKSECENLLVPVCVSSSHIAFGSIRMEPVFMILGQSAATAAAMAMDAQVAVQDLPYERLRERLIADKQVLKNPSPKASRKRRGIIDLRKLSGTILDDEDAKRSGNWTASSAQPPYAARGYQHDGNGRKGESTVRYVAELPKTGDYELRIAYSPFANRASNVPITIQTADGEHTLTLDQREKPGIDGSWHSLGTYRFAKSATVTISNAGTDGYVIADALRWLPAKK